MHHYQFIAPAMCISSRLYLGKQAEIDTYDIALLSKALGTKTPVNTCYSDTDSVTNSAFLKLVENHHSCVHNLVTGETEWKTIADNIDHEFYLVRDLAEESVYQFRIAAKNFMGWGEFSASTAAIKTAPAGVLCV